MKQFNNALEADAHNWDTREIVMDVREKIAELQYEFNTKIQNRKPWWTVSEQEQEIYRNEADQILALGLLEKADNQDLPDDITEIVVDGKSVPYKQMKCCMMSAQSGMLKGDETGVWIKVKR